jgi:MarR family transcriptional regulator, transcriptional regulator for hemolysin
VPRCVTDHAGELTIDPDSQLKRDIGMKLSVIARLLRNDFDRRVSEHSLTRSKWTVIAVVARRPGVSQRVIAETLEMSEASAGRIVDRLCNEGLLERRAKQDDRRAFSIHLTPAAKPVLETLSEIAQISEERVFRGLSVEQLTTLRDMLETLAANINAPVTHEKGADG